MEPGETRRNADGSITFFKGCSVGQSANFVGYRLGRLLTQPIPRVYLPSHLRHAKHVGRPHPDCAVCRAKGRV